MMTIALKQKLQAGSSRVFNCLAITEQLFDETPNPDLLFRHHGLNRFIFLKDIVTDWQDDSAMVARPVSTKAYWPFDTTAPNHGGESVFSFEDDYVDLLQTKVGCFGDDWRQDRLVLTILHDLPGFDPFLMRDRIRQLGIVVDPRYFDLPRSEWDDIRNHLRARLEPFVTAAYGRTRPEIHKSDLVIDQIWLHKDESHFFPFNKLLRMNSRDCGQLLDDWRGIAYYQMRYEQMMPRIRQMAEWLGMAASMIDGPIPLTWQEIQGIVHPLRRMYRDCLGQILGVLEQYDEACTKVWRQRRPDDFVLFMRESSHHFNILGTNLGKLSDAADIWQQTINHSQNNRLLSRSWLMLVRNLMRILTQET